MNDPTFAAMNIALYPAQEKLERETAGDSTTQHGTASDVAPGWRAWKRLLDVVGALFFIAVFAPIMLIVAALIATSKENIFFRQQRVGRHGKLFNLYKFRTMVPDAEAHLEAALRANSALQAEWQCHQKLRNDPRVTLLGGFLRRTSIDELPQLFNVLIGDMSLVGPRPVLAAELDRYGEAARWYRATRPGITGLWQVSGRNGTGYQRRVDLDIQYVRSQSFWLDCRILLRTVYVVIAGIGAH